MSTVVLTSLNKPIVKLSRLQMLYSIVTYHIQEDGPPVADPGKMKGGSKLTSAQREFFKGLRPLPVTRD